MSRRAVFAAITVLWASCSGEGASIPPAPVRFITDNVELLSPDSLSALEVELASFERQSGHQLVVWIGGSLHGASIEEWSARAFSAWGIGRKGEDDGVALFVFTEDRRARVEVGYGLEDVLTDAVAGRILDEHFVPAMRANDPERAIRQTTGAIRAALGQATAQEDPVVPELSLPQKILAGLGVLLLLALFIRYPWLLLLFLGRGRSGGGGFSPGGGRSGGGGGSRSW